MADILDILKDQLKEKKIKIVLPESNDERIFEAAVKLAKEKIVVPVLLGNKEELETKLTAANVDLADCIVYSMEDAETISKLATKFVEIRKGKATEEQAANLMKQVNYFGTMLVKEGLADGLVSGAIHSTADTVRPALQIIKTKPGVSKTSGVFIMVREDEKYIMADCAINIAPTSQDLAEIAIESAKTAKAFGIEPKVAMLSFSTKGSAVSDETLKVSKAVEIANELDPSIVLDGEFQFDAAFVPSVAKQKAPNSVIQGDANVFVFPSLEAGNIGYKIAQRLGNFQAIGPILQGLNAPVNDLSRGCSSDDVYKLSIITAAQCL